MWSLAIIFACMSLRRFPWKAPRVTDSSFKMFIAEPYTDPGETYHKERSRSAGDASADNRGSSGPAHGHSYHHHDHAEHPGDSSNADEVARSGNLAPSGNKSEPPKTEVMKGPWRLLRLLPRETRPIVSAMLKLDPKQRATLADITSDPWVLTSPVCQQPEHGKVLRAGAHTHTLEPGSSAPPPAAK